MLKKNRSASFQSQTGGITILVALALLVLLTIAAVGMSRNSFREVIISGTSRQGAMVRNAADAGIEWSVYWLEEENAPTATNTGILLAALKKDLIEHDLKSGRAYDVISQALYTTPPSVTGLPVDQTLTLPVASNNLTAQGFSIALTRMGKLPITDTSQAISQGGFTPAQGSDSKLAPDLWAVRSDGQLQVGTGVLAPTFIHSKEAWISTPVK